MLMRAAAKEHNWNLNYGGIALMWRGGCIIRSVFLGKIKEAFDKNPQLSNLLLDPFFRKAIKDSQRSWRKVVALAARKGIPVPAFSTALAFYDSYRSERLPANLLQAQRDYFGAHTYERVDQPRGQFFHTNWTGHGGTTASGTYTGLGITISASIAGPLTRRNLISRSAAVVCHAASPNGSDSSMSPGRTEIFLSGGGHIHQLLLVDPRLDLLLRHPQPDAIPAAGLEAGELGRLVLRRVHAVQTGDADQRAPPAADNQTAERWSPTGTVSPQKKSEPITRMASSATS